MIEIVAVRGLATVQDGGRPGRMHEGVPPGGALDPDDLARVNAAVGNPPGAAVVEWVGGLAVRALRDVRVAVGAEVRGLRPGETWALDALPHPRTLAVAGGFDVPEVLGGRGTLLAAGLGGHEGRPLRADDRLRVGHARDPSARVPPPRAPGPVRLVVGPDAPAFASEAWALLLGTEWEVGAADRVGARLVGPALPRRGEDDGASAPMVRGAVQVPRGGAPVVLGPDHPVTGGYPVLAVVVRADWGRVGAAAPGDRLSFALVAIAEARG